MKEIADAINSYITDFIKIWLMLWGVFNFPVVKHKKVLYGTLILQTVILTLTFFFNQRFPDEIMFLSVFLVILSVSFILQGKLLKKLAYSLLSYILVLFLDISIIGISSLIANMSGHDFVSNLTTRMIFNALNILTIGVVVLIKKRRKKGLINISKRVYALLFAGAATGFLTLAALLVKSNDEATENGRKIMVIVTIISVVAYIAVCLMIIIVTESRDNYKALSLINQNIIESQQQYYILVNEKHQEMRSIRHEMKNYLACIHGLYQAGKLTEMEQYIRQVIEASDLSMELFETGNEIVNAILNDAQSKHKKENILIRLQGGFPKELYIAPLDLCVIMANAVSNAIEAILRMERRKEEISYIDIKISSFKEDLYIDVQNPVDKNIDTNPGKMTTSKTDKSLHGFGVKNIIIRVEKYQGSVNFRSENRQFFVEINMKNRP